MGVSTRMVNRGRRCCAVDVVCDVACVMLVAVEEEEGKNAVSTEREGEECAASHGDGDEEAIDTALVALAHSVTEIGAAEVQGAGRGGGGVETRRRDANRTLCRAPTTCWWLVRGKGSGLRGDGVSGKVDAASVYNSSVDSWCVLSKGEKMVLPWWYRRCRYDRFCSPR
jgi:hypothetical protein